jgi:hypothetical protein
MIVVEAGHAHVMKFLPRSCEQSIFVALTVIFLKSAVMRISFIFLRVVFMVALQAWLAWLGSRSTNRSTVFKKNATAWLGFG